MGPVGFGALTTAVAVGGLASTAAYDWLERRFSLAALMRVCLLTETLVHLGLALTTMPAVAGARRPRPRAEDRGSPTP